MRRLVPLLALLALALGLSAPTAGAEPARAAVFSGTGVWVDIWDALHKNPVSVVTTAQQQVMVAPVGVMQQQPMQQPMQRAPSAGPGQMAPQQYQQQVS